MWVKEETLICMIEPAARLYYVRALKRCLKRHKPLYISSPPKLLPPSVLIFHFFLSSFCSFFVCMWRKWWMERPLPVANCSTFASHLFLTLFFLPPLFLHPISFHCSPISPHHFCPTFTPSCPLSLSSLYCREREGCLETWLEKEKSFGSGSKVHLCFSLPAARANGLVQCADFCRKLPETVCVFRCV